MEVWTIVNQKGGVGKTTTTISLGALLAENANVLLVDMDPHGSLTSYFGYNPDTLDDSVYNLFQGHPVVFTSLIRRTRWPRLFVLPASTAMATLDRQLGNHEGMGLVLTRALTRMAGRFDYVLVDCAPQLGVLMINAIAACRRLIVPVQTEFLALKGLERMTVTLDMVVRSRRTLLPYTILPTMFDKRTRASQFALDWLRERFGEKVWDGIIPVDTRFREASAAGIPLPLMMPEARGALAYGNFLATLLQSDRSTAQASHLATGT